MTTMRLQGLIEALERKEPDAEVMFDFAYFHPTKLHSYRGDYSHLAFGYSKEGAAPKVSQVIAALREADGQTFTGYKGGEFTMHERTPVWVAESSEATSTGIVDVLEVNGSVILKTAAIQW